MTKRTLRIICSVIACGVMLFLMAAGVVTAKPAKTLKVGVIAPISGSASAWGFALQRAVTLYADAYNEAGGIVLGGEKHQIELIVEDDKCLAADAMAAARKLIYGDGVRMIVGPVCSAAGAAIASECKAQDVITFIGYSSTNFLGSDYPRNFLAAAYGVESASIGGLACINKAFPNAKRLALFEPDDESGWESAKTDRMVWEYYGKEIVEKYYERETTDFFPMLTATLAKKPDIISLGISPPGAGSLIVKQARQLGYTGPIFNGWIQVNQIAEIAGAEAAEGTISIGTLADDPTNPPVLKQFVDKTRARWGELTSAWDDYGCVAYIFFNVLKAADSADVNTIYERMTAPGFKFDSWYDKGLEWGGREYYGTNCEAPVPLNMQGMKDGKVVSVARVPFEDRYPLYRLFKK